MPQPIAVTLGYEEEFFLIEEGSLHPTLQSLDCLRKLYWRNPLACRPRLASNFARGNDRKACWMSSVEVSTGVQTSVDGLLHELLEWRRKIARASRGSYCVPIGAPLELDCPSNTAGSHIHVGVAASERDRVFANLGYFLPVFAVAALNSPSCALDAPKSYRMGCNFASGELREDREYRFQDLIVSKRLGTVEIRALDPVPDMDRLRHILEGVVAVAKHVEPLPFDRARYNAERPSWVREGMNAVVERLWLELQAIYPFPKALLTSTQGDELAEVARAESPEAAYRLVDSIWRRDTGVEPALAPHSRLKSLTGVLGYYAVQLPWMAYKGYKEWHGRTPDLAGGAATPSAPGGAEGSHASVPDSAPSTPEGVEITEADPSAAPAVEGDTRVESSGKAHALVPVRATPGGAEGSKPVAKEAK